jgi:AcrR family transcriptional regulator
VARQGLTAARVTETAAAIADAEGLPSVTIARVAAELDVRAPSLYNHVGGLDALRRSVAREALVELADAMREAATGRSGADALLHTSRAYRGYVLAHPGRYAATATAPPPGDEALAAAATDVIDVMFAVLRGWSIEGDDAVHAIRGIRSAIHGFVTLETEGGFGIPLDLDVSFDRMIMTLARGLGERAAGV